MLRKFVICLMILAGVFLILSYFISNQEKDAAPLAGAGKVFRDAESPDEQEPVSEQELFTVRVSLFYGEGCPHCAKAEAFLRGLQKEFSDIEIRTFEIYHNSANAKLMRRVGEALNVHPSGPPLIVIGDEAVIGYLNDETAGVKIREIVMRHRGHDCRDITGEIFNEISTNEEECRQEKPSFVIGLPLIGNIDVSSWSLPVLTIAVAAVDGFNPCAMWVLLFLIALLLGMKDRKKMWILGVAFIASSALVYFLFLSAWLNLFLFIGFISIVRVAIGLVAIASGGYHLYEYFHNKSGVCKVTNETRRQKITERLQGIIGQKTFWLALGGIIVLAAVVNLIELVCSAGLPAIYTQILSMSELPVWAYYLYLLLYITVFMIDDLAIFVIAMTTLKLSGLSAKYSRWANLIGGIIILILGILLIFKPGWIMFG